MDISTVVFSIFDTDEGQLENLTHDADDGDDFLGRCVVDIVNMRNCDKIDEDIPILGVKARPGGFKGQGGGFRRYSSLHVEVRCERRVKRIVGTDTHIDPQLLWCPRHHTTRQMLAPKVRGYRDLSQESMASAPQEFRIAGKVLSLRESNTLMEHAQRLREKAGNVGGFTWAKIPHPTTWVPKEHKGEEEEDLHKQSPRQDSPRHSPRYGHHGYGDDLDSEPGVLMSPRRAHVFGDFKRPLGESRSDLFPQLPAHVLELGLLVRRGVAQRVDLLDPFQAKCHSRREVL